MSTWKLIGECLGEAGRLLEKIAESKLKSKEKKRNDKIIE